MGKISLMQSTLMNIPMKVFNWLKAMMNHIKAKYFLQLEIECKDKLSLLNAQEVALKKDL